MYRMKPELVSFQAPTGTEVGQELQEPLFDMTFAWPEAGNSSCDAGEATLMRHAAPFEVLKGIWRGVADLSQYNLDSNFSNASVLRSAIVPPAAISSISSHKLICFAEVVL
ncbi:hypothetical protein llap_14592 [Limosa lapponica baueri]|uniref:Uncharacterized protein n=1 Tax=Limosa lapponica baueri TaxID=1758121 RepID=A0A2I0TMS5_LIMLA|nr:hypothetical protein llap_14592 [Limosa lapponica baueri]